jgi:hypothetical protein
MKRAEPSLIGEPEPRYGLSPGRSASGLPGGAITDARRRRRARAISAEVCPAR